MRAESRSSACSIRRPNLSCIARSLLRRSAERRRITISSVSGWRASLASTPSWTTRQPSASELGAELLQLRLRRANDGAPPCLAQPRQILGAGHAAVGDKDAPERAVPRFHGGHDRLQGLCVVDVAGEHLVAQRKAVKGHDKGDQDLLAIRAMIAGIAALRLRVRFRLALVGRDGPRSPCGLLRPSPRAGPIVRIPRNGLPRVPSPASGLRSSGGAFVSAAAAA